MSKQKENDNKAEKTKQTRDRSKPPVTVEELMQSHTHKKPNLLPVKVRAALLAVRKHTQVFERHHIASSLHEALKLIQYAIDSVGASDNTQQKLDIEV